ncbi:HAD domain-containing protein [Klenkia sp. LSe6-5]|uniref:HAD domain-containing protein n=1 Tax=Klenkia sesuvii TaxID=3103137 RepID=A0ABU8DX36_9ACTN
MTDAALPPLLLLDVDGVLNAVGGTTPGRERGVFAGYTLSWDPSVTGRLAEWHRDGRVELQWLTTWARHADELLADPMGLPRGLRVHERPDGAGPTGFTGTLAGAPRWWKLAAARAVVDEDPNRRVVWVDDDLALQAEDTQAWLAEHGHVLVVAPELAEGLTHEHLDAVERWLDGE